MNALPRSTVVVVDDDETMCRSLERSLTGNGFHVLSYTSARHYLAERDHIDPQCVLADINMPEVDGVDMHRVDRMRGHDVPTVFITGRVDVPTAVRAMKEGALDLLEKPVEEAVLLWAVRRAIDRSAVLRAARRELAAVWRAFDLLTPREAEVCALVASGRRNKQVASLIGITEKTVKVHRARGMHKLGLESLADLVRLIDRVLGDASTVPGDEDWRRVHRPQSVMAMRSALDAAAKSPVDREMLSRTALHQVSREAAIAAETYY